MTDNVNDLSLKNNYAVLKNPWVKTLVHQLGDVEGAKLTLVLPNGDVFEFGQGATSAPHAFIRLNTYKAISSLFIKGDLAFAESYINGDWECPDLTTLFEFGLAIEDKLNSKSFSALIKRSLDRLRHLLNRNTRKGSQRNIAYHYDLGNTFYKRWLDPSMTYSSGLFLNPDDSLEEAQTNKYKAIAEMAELEKSDRVLEIGCGWGGFSEYAARSSGATIEGLTLSHEQLAYANDRYKKQGLSHLANASYTDYRDAEGQFDKIVSIEMFEAVGEENWDTYFQTLRDRLVPGGVAVLQIITIDNERFGNYRKETDFIQRYIFPGGFLPSPAALGLAVRRNGLTLQRSQFFGQSYAKTCALWNKSFQHAWPEIEALGYSKNFKRMWEYYLSYCEAGFKAGCIDVGFFKIAKPA